MANWKYTLSLKDFYHSDDLSINKKAEMVAERIEKTFPKNWFDFDSDSYKEEINEILDDFRWLSVDGDMRENDTDEFDNIMEDLYDWADQEVEPYRKWPPNKMCWIETQ